MTDAHGRGAERALGRRNWGLRVHRSRSMRILGTDVKLSSGVKP